MQLWQLGGRLTLKPTYVSSLASSAWRSWGMRSSKSPVPSRATESLTRLGQKLWLDMAQRMRASVSELALNASFIFFSDFAENHMPAGFQQGPHTVCPLMARRPREPDFRWFELWQPWGLELTYNYGVDNYEVGTGLTHVAVAVENPEVRG